MLHDLFSRFGQKRSEHTEKYNLFDEKFRKSWL